MPAELTDIVAAPWATRWPSVVEATGSAGRAGAVIEALMNHLHFVSPPEVVPVDNINYEGTPLLR